MSAAVAGTTFRPTPSYTTLRDVTLPLSLFAPQSHGKPVPPDFRRSGFSRNTSRGRTSSTWTVPWPMR